MEKKQTLSNWIFRIILLVFPLLHVNTGVDVADMGYNLTNFQAFPNMDSTWMISTLFANVLGKVLTFLPFGDTMLGMSVYCLLILGLAAVGFFELLRKDFKPWAVFAGVFLALCLCWSPKFILYQYFTYYLFSFAAFFLVKGLAEEKNRLLYFSGIILGINLFFRFPNIVEAGLIVLVFYHAILKKSSVKELFSKVGICMAGYFTVALPVIVLIEVIFGFGSYFGMIQGLFGMTEEASSYTPVAMIKDAVWVYLEYLKWFACFVLGTLAGYAVYVFLPKKWMKYVFTGVFVAGFGLILLFMYKLGKLDFRFTEYVSIYPWGIYLLYFAILFACISICKKKEDIQKRLMGAMILLVIAITPLGSNNNVYSNFNNLFLVAPYVFGTMAELFPVWSKKEWKPKKFLRVDFYPAMLMCLLIVAVICIQSFCFGISFNFRDKATFSSELVTITGNERLKGMRTTKGVAKPLEELTAFVEEKGLKGTETVFFGHIPMVSYALELPCAISHPWPSLDSYPKATFEEELNNVEGSPLVIYEATYYGNLLQKDVTQAFTPKEGMLIAFLQKGEYTEIYRNDKYVICAAKDAEIGE